MTEMPSFCVAKRVIFQAHSGHLTSERLIESNQRVTELVRSGIAPVHLVVHTSKQLSVDLNLKQLAEEMTFLKEEKLGWIVLVSTNELASFLASVLTEAESVDFKLVTSLEAAWDTLQSVDSTLADVPSPFDTI